MEIFEWIVLLRNSPVFSRVATEDLRIVAQHLQPEQYVKGDCVFRVGDLGEQMYVVCSGAVDISLSDKHRQADVVTRCTEGDCFGELNLLDDLPRSASAFVTEDTTLLALEKRRLLGLVTTYPELALGMMRGLSARIRRLSALVGAGEEQK